MAAAGEQDWSEAEIADRDRSPRWIISEATAHVQIASLLPPSMQSKHWEAAMRLIESLPNEGMRNTSIELLMQQIPEDSRAQFAEHLRPNKELRSQAWRYVPAYLGCAALAIAATILIFLFFADANVPIEQDQLIADGTVIESGWQVVENQVTKGSPSPELNAGEVVNYEAKISSPLKIATLLSLDYDPSHTHFSSKELDDGQIEFAVQYQADPRNYYQYFIVVVANKPIFSDPSAHAEWLEKVAVQLQELSSQDDPDQNQAKAIFLQGLRSAGYDQEVIVEVDRIICHDVR